MKTSQKLPSLYPIIDTIFVSQEDMANVAEKILKGGATIIQLRAKDASVKNFIEMARDIKEVTDKYKATFIINDRVDICLLVDADGIHIGQEDLPLKEARKLLGEDKIIGISTHTIEEASDAEKDGADYIAFGPIYKTKTKTDTHSVQGLDKLKKISEVSNLPLVAIGGINKDNISEVMKQGATSSAVISDILNTKNIEETVRSLISTIS